MAIQADIPPDLTDEDKALVFQVLDVVLNSQILYALLHGIYTGILGVTLWNMFINKRWPNRRVLVVVIILLHALTTINFAAQWSSISSLFIENGQSFWTVNSKLNGVDQAFIWEMGFTATISTILADSYIIWCCWMVWEQCWLIVLPPILCLISTTVSKIIIVYHDYFDESESALLTLYLSSTLATTLWCTLFIIYRMLTVNGVVRGAGSRLRVYRRFIKVLVESSALYSIALVLFLAVFLGNDVRVDYFDVLTAIAKGIAPTLLIGKATAGHTLPTEERDESSPVSTIRFQTSSQSSQSSQPESTSSFQESTRQSAVLELDIEAQRERSDELVVVVERTQ
ncbi:uncharacterized protein EV420DRAFT_344979 [Desarmillaria tabescens]|uniref:Uncharacterized protein n=1 Tax=Armillaria tabescens TaxID=1929756 RepID=A0AA39KD71_ARMTA|nr:uncharacterized protein EV420DRAFT_344979 [Desarmillaria tabescens]KAK0458999.1 hypothetical protein EV420DRAFT_344979 [Desarmillaria tabescens]